MKTRNLLALSLSLAAIVLSNVAHAGIYNLYHRAAAQDWVAPAVSDLGLVGQRPAVEFPGFKGLLQPFEIQHPTLQQRYLEVYDLIGEPEGAGQINEFVEMAEEQSGAESLDFAAALALQAFWLIEHRQAGQAIEPLDQAIRIAKREAGVFAPELVQLHILASVARQGIGKYRRSQYHLDQAISLLHRLDGTLTDRQLPLMYLKADNFSLMDRQRKGEKVLRSALRIAKHNYGSTSIESLTPARMLLRHLMDNNEQLDALSLVRDVRQEFAGPDDQDSPVVVPFLAEAAVLHLVSNSAEVDRGLRMQREIVEIIDQYPESFSLDETIEARLRLGDWLIMFDLEEEAAEVYQAAWDMSQSSERSGYWQKLFAEPQLISAGPNPTLKKLGYHRANRLGYTRFEYQVDESGRPKELKTLDSNLHATSIREVQNLFRLARFRPILEDGTLQPSGTVEYLRIYDTSFRNEISGRRLAPRRTMRLRTLLNYEF